MGKIRNKILRSILLSSVLSFLGTNAEAAPSNVTLDNDNNDDQDLINSLKSNVTSLPYTPSFSVLSPS